MNFNSSMFKEIARRALHGRWGKSIVTTLVASLLGAFCTVEFFLTFFGVAVTTFVDRFEGVQMTAYIDVALIAIVIALMYFFIGGMIRFGYVEYTLALLDRRTVNLSMLFCKGHLAWNGIYMKIMCGIAKYVAALFFIVPGVFVHYMYAMVPYILAERPDISVRRAMSMSRRVMRGHKWQLFCLRVSFLGWRVLGVLTCGVLSLIIKPYQYTAEAAFYNEISGRARIYYQRR